MSTNAYVPCELRDEEYHNSYCVLQEGEQCRKGERTREKSRDITGTCGTLQVPLPEYVTLM